METSISRCLGRDQFLLRPLIHLLAFTPARRRHARNSAKSGAKSTSCFRTWKKEGMRPAAGFSSKWMCLKMVNLAPKWLCLSGNDTTTAIFRQTQFTTCKVIFPAGLEHIAAMYNVWVALSYMNSALRFAWSNSLDFFFRIPGQEQTSFMDLDCKYYIYIYLYMYTYVYIYIIWIYMGDVHRNPNFL